MVARDGQAVFAKGYGRANRATGAIADTDTRFRIGSITKQFTAVAVLQLAERGKLRLDDALARYVPGLPFGDHVALYHLLTQTSGIASYTAVAALMNEADRPHTQAQVLASFADTPLAFEPGARFQYSNSNYYLLGMVIEKTTGGSYEDYLQRNVLGPAGMSRTSTIDAPDAPNTAAGYAVHDGAIVPAAPLDMSLPFAAGALRSTPGDLVKWDRALAGDSLLGEASRRRMLSPMHDRYAYGVKVWTLAGRQVIDHGGGINGFTSQLERVPSEGLVAAVLSNVESPAADQIADVIVKMALEGTQVPPIGWPERPLDDVEGARFAGSYALDPASAAALDGKLPDEVLASMQKISLTLDGAHLRMKPNGQGDIAIFFRADGVLFAEEAPITLKPEQATGTMTSFVLEENGKTMRYVRLS
jgi:CubicO group peptidase (beta-lactamase class C family)